MLASRKAFDLPIRHDIYTRQPASTVYCVRRLAVNMKFFPTSYMGGGGGGDPGKLLSKFNNCLFMFFQFHDCHASKIGENLEQTL